MQEKNQKPATLKQRLFLRYGITFGEEIYRDLLVVFVLCLFSGPLDRVVERTRTSSSLSNFFLLCFICSLFARRLVDTSKYLVNKLCGGYINLDYKDPKLTNEKIERFTRVLEKKSESYFQVLFILMFIPILQLIFYSFPYFFVFSNIGRSTENFFRSIYRKAFCLPASVVMSKNVYFLQKMLKGSIEVAVIDPKVYFESLDYQIFRNIDLFYAKRKIMYSLKITNYNANKKIIIMDILLSHLERFGIRPMLLDDKEVILYFENEHVLIELNENDKKNIKKKQNHSLYNKRKSNINPKKLERRREAIEAYKKMKFSKENPVDNKHIFLPGTLVEFKKALNADINQALHIYKLMIHLSKFIYKKFTHQNNNFDDIKIVLKHKTGINANEENSLYFDLCIPILDFKEKIKENLFGQKFEHQKKWKIQLTVIELIISVSSSIQNVGSVFSSIGNSLLEKIEKQGNDQRNQQPVGSFEEKTISSTSIPQESLKKKRYNGNRKIESGPDSEKKSTKVSKIKSSEIPIYLKTNKRNDHYVGSKRYNDGMGMIYLILEDEEVPRHVKAKHLVPFPSYHSNEVKEKENESRWYVFFDKKSSKIEKFKGKSRENYKRLKEEALHPRTCGRKGQNGVKYYGGEDGYFRVKIKPLNNGFFGEKKRAELIKPGSKKEVITVIHIDRVTKH